MTAGWHPVALAADVDPGTSFGTRLLGQEFVVWRDMAGVAHVWEDRCPHRGMRLSFGFVRGDHIACLYHGWRFDGDGRCRFIPAHPDLAVPPTITTGVKPSAECDGLIWTTLDAAAVDAPAAHGSRPVPVRSLAIEAPAGIVRATIGATPPGWEVTPTLVPSTDPVIAIQDGDLRVILALQPLSSRETCLHVLVEGAGGAAERAGVSRRCEALRRAAEAQTLETEP